MPRKEKGEVRYFELHNAHLSKEKAKRRAVNKNAKRARRINRNK